MLLTDYADGQTTKPADMLFRVLHERQQNRVELSPFLYIEY